MVSTTLTGLTIENCLIDNGIFFEDAGMVWYHKGSMSFLILDLISMGVQSNNYSNALITNNNIVKDFYCCTFLT